VAQDSYFDGVERIAGDADGRREVADGPVREVESRRDCLILLRGDHLLQDEHVERAYFAKQSLGARAELGCRTLSAGDILGREHLVLSRGRRPHERRTQDKPYEQLLHGAHPSSGV
jgi:hypothetical protein